MKTFKEWLKLYEDDGGGDGGGRVERDKMMVGIVKG